MFEELKEIICNYVEVEPSDIHLDSRFMEDLGFTSFDFVSMMGELEEQYDIEIDPAQAGSVRTVQEAVDYLTSLVK